MRATLLVLPGLATANENGLARLPPMGWRSWNLYGGNVNQQLMEGIMDGMARKDREVDGKKMSLCDLGYCDVGLDDNWQNCKGGADGNHYHDHDGNPVINTDRFPDQKAMTDKAHSLGLTAGWYGNNCICSDHNSGDRKYYEGDTKALRKFGYDGYKLDGCGSQTDMQLWDDVIKATPKQSGRDAIMVENCHWGSKVPFEPNATWCPWNFYRSSGDVRANYGSIIGNLGSVSRFNSKNLSYPGCWAYPDMLEVGVKRPGLSPEETRTHFGGWVIVSSPLTLSHDVNDNATMDTIWPVISNPEVLAVSQCYAGYSGGQFKKSEKMIQLDEVDHSKISKFMTEEEKSAVGPMVSGTWQYLYKPMEYGGTKTAVLMLNQDTGAQDLSLTFSDVPGLKCTSCKVRDIWNRKDLGTFDNTFTVKGLASHDAAFIVITPA